MSRNLNQNLYAEEIIVESPYYYDNHGRLRIRVLEESMPTRSEPEDDEETQTRKEYLAQKQPVIRDMRARSPEEKAFEREREKQKDEEDYQKFKQAKAAKKGATPPAPVAPKPVKDVQKSGLGDLKSTGPMIDKDAPKKNILSPRDERVKARTEKLKTEIQNLKKTDPEAYRAKVERGKKVLAKYKEKRAAQKATPVGNIRTADMQDRNLDGTDDRDQREAPPTNDRPRLGSGNLKKTDPNAYKAALRDKVKKDVADLRNLKKTDPKAYEERSRKAREKLKAYNLKKRGGSNINVKPTRPVPRPNLETK